MRRIPLLLLFAAPLIAPITAHAESASPAQDRYGPPSTAARQAEPAQAAATQDALPPKTLLKWIGKDRPARLAAVVVTTPAAAAATASRTPARIAAQPAPARMQSATQLLGGPQAAPGAVAAPPSIYSPPARMAATPAPQPFAQSMPAPAYPTTASRSRGPRLYSVAREFGMRPDPTPLAVHKRDGEGMILAEVPTNDVPPEEALPERRRVTNAAGETKIIERPRTASAN